MVNGLPCPNPTCTHVFPPAAVAGAAALTCPRCGTLFQFRSVAAPAYPAPPAYPGALPVAAIAPPQALPAAVPHYQPPTHERFDLDAPSPDGNLVAAGEYRGSDGSGWFALKATIAVLLLGGLVLGGVYMHQVKGWFHFASAEKTPTSNAAPTLKPINSDASNFTLRVPGTEWRQDEAAQTAAKVNLIFKRGTPPAWMAVIAKDFKTHTPRERELVDLFSGRMRDYLGVAQQGDTEEAKLAGQPAMRIAFRGNIDKFGEIVGEAYLMAFNSYGYALVTWTAEESYPKVGRDFEDLRKNFAILNPKLPAVKKPEPRVFLAAKGNFTLQDDDGLWARRPALESLHKADMVLLAEDPDNPTDAAGQAMLVVAILPRAKNAKLAPNLARDNLERRLKLDHPKGKLEVLKDEAGKPLEEDAAVGDQDGHVMRLRLKGGKDGDRFLILAVVPGPQQVIAIQGECPWDKRGVWEHDFEALLRSLRMRTK
ncbi:MAG: hypothetical protein K2R98_16590 [Gemmataceae bacterium]|nr:hypothetical protein [Gemmataceae bacterium]